jgi:small membrane protein
MIAQSTLSLLLCSVLVYAWAEYRRSPTVALLSCVVSLVGLYFVWVPSHSTRVAEFIGVGRGVDLILYLWVCISLIVLLNLHLKLRAQHELITALARTIALENLSFGADQGVQWRNNEAPSVRPPWQSRRATSPSTQAPIGPND